MKHNSIRLRSLLIMSILASHKSLTAGAIASRYNDLKVGDTTVSSANVHAACQAMTATGTVRVVKGGASRKTPTEFGLTAEGRRLLQTLRSALAV